MTKEKGKETLLTTELSAKKKHHFTGIPLITWTCLIISGVIATEGAAAKCSSHFSYHFIKQTLSFIKAKKTCTNYNNGSVPTLSQHREKLLDIMRQNKLNRVWVAVYKEMMAEWQWVDNLSFKRCLPPNMYDDTFLRSVNDHHCAILHIPEQKIKPFPCYSPHICFICSFPSNEIYDSNKFRKWFRVNKNLMTIGNKANSWYSARQQCRKSGGDLVTLDDKNKVLDIIDEVEKPPKSFDCDKLFIGLHLDHWIDGSTYLELELVEDEVWLENEPKRDNCAELVVKEDNKTGLKAIDCLTRNNVICAYPDNARPADVKVQRSSKEMRLAYLALPILLVPIIVIIICVKGKKSCKRTTAELPDFGVSLMRQGQRERTANIE